MCDADIWLFFTNEVYCNLMVLCPLNSCVAPLPPLLATQPASGQHQLQLTIPFLSTLLYPQNNKLCPDNPTCSPFLQRPGFICSPTLFELGQTSTSKTAGAYLLGKRGSLLETPVDV